MRKMRSNRSSPVAPVAAEGADAMTMAQMVEITRSLQANVEASRIEQASIPFATKLFTPHFLCIGDNSPPILHKNHNLTYSPIFLPSQEKPILRTWLSQNPTKINTFCNQTFHTSFFMHL